MSQSKREANKRSSMASVVDSTTPKQPEPGVPNLIGANMLMSQTFSPAPTSSKTLMSPVQLKVETPPMSVSEEEEYMTEGPGWLRMLAIAVGVLGTTVILGVLTFLVFSAPQGTVFTTPPPSLCTTFGCIEHAYYLNKSMLRSVSPCDNFYQFVCGSWTAPRRRQTSVGQNLHESVAGAIQAIANLHPPESRTKGTRKAFDMYISCVEAHDIGNVLGNLNDLKRFMDQRGLAISAEDTGADALDQLVDLAVNWNLNFIFEMAPHKPQGQTEWMLVIYPGSLIEHFTVSEQTGAAFGEYLRHHLARGFGNATDVIAAFPAFRKQVEQATAVLNEPLNSTKYPWLRFTFGEIEEHAPNIDSAHWTTTVNRHFAAYSVRFRNDSIVFVTDRRVLQALNSLMRAGRPAFRLPVTAYIAWKFVELFGWVLDDKISEIRFGETDKQLLQEARRVACASFVERTFAFAMSARYLFDSVEGITRGLVSSLITSIQDAMLDFTDNSDWMDPKTKGDFKLRVSDIERTIWITGISAYPGKLTALYSHFPVMIHNFVVNWIESNRALSRRLVSLLADESSATSESDRRTAYAEYRANSDPSQSLYLYHLNSMIMPMSLLFKPMYVPEGTQAMNYAGFGALYSQLQIKLLDTVGIQFNENRQLASWMTASPMARYDAKVRCFFSRESQVDLWERLAFQVVLKAFQQSKSEAHAHGIRLQGLEEFSDDAVFYMSYCYISCARTAAKTRVVRRSHVCNAIIDTEHFRKTFNCPPRPLNQQNECPRFW